MHNEVTARFGGRDLVFKINRADLELFEHLFEPAFQKLMAIGGGKWTVTELKHILGFALLSPAEIDRLREREVDARLDGELARGRRLAQELLARLDGRTIPHPCENAIVNAAFAKNAPGLYVPLVQAVLTSALLGISDDEASFTDESA